MTFTNPQYGLIRDRTERYCDGVLSAEDTAALERLLRDDPQALEFFVRYMEVHSQIAWNIRAYGAANNACGTINVDLPEGGLRAAGGLKASRVGRRGSGEAVGDKSEIYNLDIPAPSPEPSLTPVIFVDTASPVRHSLLPLDFSVGNWAFSYTVATVIVGAMILGAWALTITHPCNIADNSRGQTAPGESAQKRPEMVFVGRVTGVSGVKWSADPRYLPPLGLAYVPLGRKYKLDAGLMEITYDSGAKVILEGPCTYEVESGRGGFLALGKLTARVESAKPQAANPKSQIPNQQISNPQSPIPNPLFSVRTPTAVVTDLGTEFGVEVDTRGNSLVQVLIGRVDLATQNGLHRLQLSADGEQSAARVEVGVGSIVPVSPGEQKFVRQMPLPKPPPKPRELVASRFDRDDEGWQASEDATPCKYLPEGGNHGGCIEATDNRTVVTFYFIAPAKFHGDWSAALGGQLWFDVQPRYVGAPNREWVFIEAQPKVMLVGGGRQICTELPGAPQSDRWNSYRLPLRTTGGWHRLDKPDSPAATEDDLRAVLGDVRELRIRGEYIDGPDMARLDNVILLAPPTADSEERGAVGKLTNQDQQGKYKK